jgi:hypothetical protein
MIGSVLLYDLRGEKWVVLPLAWAIERLCNGFWHVWWSVHFREYSPGLLSSILIWMDCYFIVRYRPVGEALAPRALWPAGLIGLLAATFLAFYIPLVKGRETRKKVGA